MAGYDEFWGRMKKGAPGMLDLGLGMWNRGQAMNEAAGKLAKAQGPAYQSAMATASMDPNALASQEFNAAHGMLAGVDAKSEADLMRQLHAKGLLGVANHNPGIEGVDPSATAMNPHMAAYYATRNARDRKMVNDSRTAADARIGTALNRAGQAQSMGLQAQRTQPSRALSNVGMLKGLSGVLKDTGMLDMGVDFLRKQFGGNDIGFDIGFGDYWN